MKTNQNKTPTAGAQRAANLIVNQDGELKTRDSVDAARIIDSETGAPEVLEALKLAKEAFESLPAREVDVTSEAYLAVCAAIAKAERRT